MNGCKPEKPSLEATTDLQNQKLKSCLESTIDSQEWSMEAAAAVDVSVESVKNCGTNI